MRQPHAPQPGMCPAPRPNPSRFIGPPRAQVHRPVGPAQAPLRRVAEAAQEGVHAGQDLRRARPAHHRQLEGGVLPCAACGGGALGALGALRAVGGAQQLLQPCGVVPAECCLGCCPSVVELRAHMPACSSGSCGPTVPEPALLRPLPPPLPLPARPAAAHLAVAGAQQGLHPQQEAQRLPEPAHRGARRRRARAGGADPDFQDALHGGVRCVGRGLWVGRRAHW